MSALDGEGGSACAVQTAAPPKTAAAPISAPAPAPAPPQRAHWVKPDGTGSFCAASSTGPLLLVINLDRRADRIEQLNRLNFRMRWERLPAVDGRALSWSTINKSLIHPQALQDATYAESKALPTICRRTGSFSPHLTLGALGTGLSHRAAWECLAQDPGRRDWALIMEDDVSGFAEGFEAKLELVLKTLPSTWQICYLGFHESAGTLVRAHETPRVMELPPRQAVTGLFGYLLRRDAAAKLIKSVFPLRYQVDFAMCQSHSWGANTRFVLNPSATLVTSPKSEEGACDTDVQTLGDPRREAHRAMPPNMCRI